MTTTLVQKPVQTGNRLAAAEARQSVTLIPQSKYDAILRLDRVLQESRTAIRQASPMARAFITAAAMKELENAITDEMMADIMNLMDSPLGFKTDRKPGTTKRIKKGDQWVDEKVEPYHKQTIKRCVIVALLAGANLSGNEFNILVGQTYFTKEFMQRAVLAFPGINNFRMEIGAPTKHGEKTAALEGRATWKIGSEEFSLECRKTDSGDMRIIVSAYDSSGVDQLRGLAESKLLRRVFQALTGIKSVDPDDSDLRPDNTALEGKLGSPIQIEHEAVVKEDLTTETAAEADAEGDEDVESASDDSAGRPNEDQVFFFIDSACEKIEEAKTVDIAAKVVGQALNDLDELGWPDSTKEFVSKSLQERNAVAFARFNGMKKK